MKTIYNNTHKIVASVVIMKGRNDDLGCDTV